MQHIAYNVNVLRSNKINIIIIIIIIKIIILSS